MSVTTDTFFADYDRIKILCEDIVNQPIPEELFISVFRTHCQPEMLNQFPFMKEIEIAEIDFRDTKPFITSLCQTHGSMLEVKPQTVNLKLP